MAKAHFCTCRFCCGVVLEEVDFLFISENKIWRMQEDNTVKPGSNQEKILAAMESSQEDMWVREISRTLGMDASLVSREVNELTKKGLIEKVKSKVNGKTPYKVNKKMI